MAFGTFPLAEPRVTTFWLVTVAPSRMVIASVAGPQHYTFVSDCRESPYSDVNVRLALKYGIDRQEMVDKILFGHGTLGNDHPIGPTIPYHADLPQREQDLDKARYIICGEGRDLPLLIEQAGQSPIAGRFSIRGHVDDIASVLAVTDVYGYPLTANTFAAAEQNLQEALYAGCPAIVFPVGGIPHLVRHGETGFIVESEGAYAAALRRLYHDPALRARMGASAAAHARRHFQSADSARAFRGVYTTLMNEPAREPSALPAPSGGTGLMLRSLGSFAEPFRQSLAPGTAQRQRADTAIARLDDLHLRGTIERYLHAFPAEPAPHYWRGLILNQRGHEDDALESFLAAARCGHARAAAFALCLYRAMRDRGVSIPRALSAAELPMQSPLQSPPPPDALPIVQSLHDEAVDKRIHISGTTGPDSLARIPAPGARGFYIWGAGDAGRAAFARCRQEGLAPDGFLDIDPAKQASGLHSLPVLAPASVLDLAERPFLLLANHAASRLARELARAGWKHGTDYALMP